MISTYTSKLKQLQIGDLIAKIPIIQGGMGVGISRSHLAGAVAKEGGVGIISTAQIGYDEEGFENDQAGCNLKAIKKHIRKAKELACGNGLVGVNIMVALKHYKEHVQAAVAAGADVIISGAGLPMNLPELVSRTCRTKIAPIVSSKRATQLILKMWAHRYDRTADFIVVWNSGIVHAIWNIVMIGGGLAIGQKADQFSVMTYVLDAKSFAVTGGEFGIEASVISLMGYIIVTGVAFFGNKELCA